MMKDGGKRNMKHVRTRKKKKKKENIKREHIKTKMKQKGKEKIKRRQGEDINEKADQ